MRLSCGRMAVFVATVGMLLSITAWPAGVEAGTLVGEIQAHGKTKEEAEARAARDAARKVMTEHYGLAAHNPLTEAIARLDPSVLSDEFFEKPAGGLRKTGDGFEGRLIYYLSDGRARGIIAKQVQGILRAGGIKMTALAVTAGSTAHPLDGIDQVKIAGDLSSSFAAQSSHFGLAQATVPVEVSRKLSDIVRKAGSRELVSNSKADIETIADQATKTERGKADIVIAGYFNLFEERQQGAITTIAWELRGTIIDYSQAGDGKSNDFSVTGASVGTSWETALRVAYDDLAFRFITQQLLEKLTLDAKTGQPQVVVCGAFDLDERVEFQGMLKKEVKADRIAAEKDGRTFTVSGEGIEAIEVYSSIKKYVKGKGWKADIRDNRLLVGDLDRCGS